MVQLGLDVFLDDFPRALRGARIGLLCHAASVTGGLRHAVDALAKAGECAVAAIFGPQHGLFGQTQDNMIEWEGTRHPSLGVPVYSLYGAARKPTVGMLEGLNALVIDLQDVGARPYTYAWTMKLCMEACAEASLPVWVLDRPNPIAAVPFDGELLDCGYFTFVGGARLPLCHRLTLGEMARHVGRRHLPGCELNVVPMKGWWRNSLWPETGLPWVLPSPNMPTFDTALVYPGMVLLEGTNLSEGRGTTRPFELFGAPYLDRRAFAAAFDEQGVARGCSLREHDFIPTFQKWQGELCTGWQVHVVDPRALQPVRTAVGLIAAALRSCGGRFAFKEPPYEYENRNMPFDILSGSPAVRKALLKGERASEIASRWEDSRREAAEILDDVSLYPEERP